MRHRFLIMCLGLVVILRLPSLFEPYWYGDEGIYLTLGLAIKKGLVLYRDIHDNKPPFLYLLAFLAGSVFWFRAILLTWMLVTVALFWDLVSRLFPQQPKITRISVLVFAILSSLPLIEGNIANAEIFMIGLTMGGFYLFFRAESRRQFLAAGLLFSGATLFKVPAGFDFGAAVIFALFWLTRKNFKNSLLNLATLGLGYFLPILLTTLYFAANGALAFYLKAAFLQNIPYLSSWAAGTMAGSGAGAKTGLMMRGGILLVALLAVYRLKRDLSRPVVLVVVWFLLALFAAALSERPYPHYLIQVLPAFCLILGLLFTDAKKVVRRLTLGLIVGLAMMVIAIQFWVYPVFGYYTNFLSYLSGLKNESRYLAWFSPQVNQTYDLAKFLSTHTTEKEKIFIWGDEPNLYALAQRLPVGRYTVAYHIADFNGYQETMAQLQKNLPRYIIVMKGEKRPFLDLIGFIDNYYILEKNLDGAKIFRRQSII